MCRSNAYLKRVRRDLVRESDPSPFLSEVDHGAAPVLLDIPKGQIQLLPAVASFRAEHLRGRLSYGRMAWSWMHGAINTYDAAADPPREGSRITSINSQRCQETV